LGRARVSLVRKCRKFRDTYAYNFDATKLRQTAKRFVRIYTERLAIATQTETQDVDPLIDIEDTGIKWTRHEGDPKAPSEINS
jgi:hypothetical protein